MDVDVAMGQIPRFTERISCYRPKSEIFGVTKIVTSENNLEG